jgi:hypothetical protein
LNVNAMRRRALIERAPGWRGDGIERMPYRLLWAL